MKRITLLAALAIAACSTLAAKDYWYVCLGSFKKQSNADNYVLYLKAQGLSARISDVQLAEGCVMHRVLFSTPSESYADAFDKRTKLQKQDFITKLGINDLWVCRTAPADGMAGSGSPCQQHSSGPIDSDVRSNVWLEPADYNPAAQRRIPTWDDEPLDAKGDFKVSSSGDFELVSNGGFSDITVTRYEFKR